MIGPLFHGGVPGLRPGDCILPGSGRHQHDGCPFCEARARGIDLGIDKPTGHPEHVYATTHRIYAKSYASLYGRGDLYRVEPAGELTRSDEDLFETYRAPAFTVAAVLDRAVLMTESERRRLMREWPRGDREPGYLDLQLSARRAGLRGIGEQIYRQSERQLRRLS